MYFADRIRNELQLRDWSVKRFADEIGKSPEHARKIRDGTALPGPELTQTIAAKLRFEPEVFQEEVDTAKWEKLRGRKPPKPEKLDLSPIEGVWTRLTADQREYILCVANCLVMKKSRRA